MGKKNSINLVYMPKKRGATKAIERSSVWFCVSPARAILRKNTQSEYQTMKLKPFKVWDSFKNRN